jgi:hypothetical protein
MHVGRRIWLLAAVGIGLAGCRAADTGSLSFLPRRHPSPLTFDLDEFVAEHNRNAEAIDSLQAKPSIEVSTGRVGRASVDGRLALERPRNFKLEVEAQGVRKADIGSNAEEFWYWVANPDKDQKWVYWCNYRDLESSDLPVTYQPEWIIEAMGLKPITAREAAAIKVSSGSESGTSLLTFPATRDRGGAYVREMEVSNSDRRIKRLRIFTEAPRVLIAQSQAEDFKEYPTGGTTASSAGETCVLPQKLRLQWKREQLGLVVTLKDVTVNQFDHAMGADIFVEPQMPGYSRLNLAEQSRGARTDRRTRTRQTMAPPDSRNDIDLGRPAPISDEEPTAPNVSRRATAPAPDSDLPTLPTLDDLVGAHVSRPPNQAPLQSSSFPGPPGRDSTIER